MRILGKYESARQFSDGQITGARECADTYAKATPMVKQWPIRDGHQLNVPLATPCGLVTASQWRLSLCRSSSCTNIYRSLVGCANGQLIHVGQKRGENRPYKLAFTFKKAGSSSLLEVQLLELFETYLHFACRAVSCRLSRHIYQRLP